MMAPTLHLLVWIAVLHMSLGQYQPLPPIWGWGRHYDTNYYNGWQATASAHKYPLSPHQPGFAALPLDLEKQESVRSPDCGHVNTRSSEVPIESRMNQRSITTGDRQKLEASIRVYQPKTEEMMVKRSDTASSKIMPQRRRGQIDSSKIIFPGPTSPTSSNEEDKNMPEDCQNATFCEEAPLDYPQEAIDKYIEENRKQFQKDILPDIPKVTQRLGGGPTESNIELCNFTEKVVYPLQAKGPDDKWYSLVNRKDDPVQGFKVEICKQDESPCSQEIMFFNSGYGGRCKQKHVYRTAHVIDKTTGSVLNIVQKAIKLPSCCSCVGYQIF